MSISQPLVFRVYFNNESDVQSAQRKLNESGVRSDYIKSFTKDEPGKWKMIFTHEHLFDAEVAIGAFGSTVVEAGYFNPANDWTQEFQPLKD